MASTDILIQLADEISSQAAIVTDYVKANNLPAPSFDSDGPLDPLPSGAPSEVEEARFALMSATKKLHALARGPGESIKWLMDDELFLLGSLKVLCHFNVPQNVPLSGCIAIAELAAKAGMDAALLPRYLRVAIANHYFFEPRPGFVAHSAWSKPLAVDERLRGIVHYNHGFIMPMIGKLVEAAQVYHAHPDPQHAPFALAFGDAIFDYQDKHPDAMRLFSQLLEAVAQGPSSVSAEMIADSYAWHELPGDALVVDIGGNIGYISAAIAQVNPHLRFQIQDFEHLADKSAALMEARGLADRIRFRTHNFFDAQPETSRGAAVYLLKYILHDWPDEDCRRILKPIVDAMGPDSRIVISDVILPEPSDGSLSNVEETRLGVLDLIMLSIQNAKERSLVDWQELLTSVDARLKITHVVGKPKMKTLSLFEVRLMG